MEFPNGIQSLKNKTILVTGATGFLGKVLVEKILRIQPDIKKLYILLRAKDDKQALERMYNQIISKDLFKVVKEEHGVNFEHFISRKVIPVAGDTTSHDLGIQDSNLKEEMWSEIDAVLHQAASTRLEERYDIALDINTMGAKNIINFAKNCTKLKILIHVSTAYVCGDGTGVIPEREFKMGETLSGVSGLDIDSERRLAQDTLLALQNKRASPKQIRRAMKDLGLQRARMYGWPNTYVFSKALGEMLLGELRDNLHIAIVRPTMICSTWKDPFPGWIEGLGHIVMVAMGYAKGYIKFLRADRDVIMDLIPVDMVVNAMVAIMVAQVKEPSLAIYQVGSSLRNPIAAGKISDLHYQYFSKKPWIDDKGVAAKCINPKYSITKSRFYFAILCALHIFSCLALAIVDILSCHFYKVNYRRMMIQLVAGIKFSTELYTPYSLLHIIFDDLNSENLRSEIRRRRMNLDGFDFDFDFDFDPKSIEWEDYMLHAHLPGVQKYCFPNGHLFHGY